MIKHISKFFIQCLIFLESSKNLEYKDVIVDKDFNKLL